jgi:hypothetical protein
LIPPPGKLPVPDLQDRGIAMYLTKTFSTLALCLCAGMAMAQDAAPALSLELNSVGDTADGGCRLTYVANNGMPAALEKTSFQMAVFDGTGSVTRLIVLDFGALTVGKTKVVQFDIPGQTCAQISRIVVNDVAQCTAAGGAALLDCMTSLATASRTAIQFGL